MKNIFLEGERLALRALEPEDARLLAACNNDPAVRVSFFTHTPTSLHLQRARIESFYGAGADYIPFAICIRDGGEAIGVTAWHRVDFVSRAAVFSICLCEPSQWGKGYAREATQLMLHHGFDIMNFHRVQLHVWEGNGAAIRVYESCGFKTEGLLREAMCHDGKYCNFRVMGILEQEYRSADSKVVKKR